LATSFISARMLGLHGQRTVDSDIQQFIHLSRKIVFVMKKTMLIKQKKTKNKHSQKYKIPVKYILPVNEELNWYVGQSDRQVFFSVG